MCRPVVSYNVLMVRQQMPLPLVVIRRPCVLKSHSDLVFSTLSATNPLFLFLFPVHGEATNGALEPLLRGEHDQRGGGRRGQSVR